MHPSEGQDKTEGREERGGDIVDEEEKEEGANTVQADSMANPQPTVLRDGTTQDIGIMESQKKNSNKTVYNVTQTIESKARRLRVKCA
ncbi:hypothetical protein M378DRAFT_170733 [Amanita muscaria Koide BX008]|uniref:Uncharacterized protein n=1 Tax=Amanita muscaria (strain Koide BX008) TaxID=946122 RepID=A0A0C2WAM2_AMAMK|nr:hypothetical protein M378DRAFT_170733 [Amanita muscaria Koide BX008]